METMNGWLGDRMLVNGRVQPTLDVDRRTYRVRLLNDSNARFFKLAWSDASAMTVIGSDGGLLAQARTERVVTLAPGQRTDVLLDLSQHARGTEVQLRSRAFPAADVGRAGMMVETSASPQGVPLTLMTLRLSGSSGPRYEVPARLSMDAFRQAAQAPVRRVPLFFIRVNWFIDGRTFDLRDVADAETVAPGSTHIWEFINQPNPMAWRWPTRSLRMDHSSASSRARAARPTPYAGEPRRGLDRHGGRVAGRNRPHTDDLFEARGPLSGPLPCPRTRGHGHDAKLPDPRLTSNRKAVRHVARGASL